MDAGKLSETVCVLKLVQTDGAWEWTQVKKTWADIDAKTAKSIYSAVGVSAMGASLTMRRQGITLHNALLWEGRHLFLTGIRKNGRLYMDVDAAIVKPDTCLATRTETRVGAGGRPVKTETMRIAFPAVLTEKYARYVQETTHAESDIGLVLVTPKVIGLKPGDIVTVQGGNAPGVYHVTVPHELDDYKNEYEIARRGDV
jgi:hypothetical protein|nr:MAG TPA: putative head-tail adaptor [Caudoviricetes sp.]